MSSGAGPFAAAPRGWPADLPVHVVEAIVTAALAEDVGWGDVTTQAIVPPAIEVTGNIVARQPGIVCGLPVAEVVFRRLAGTAAVEPLLGEGEPCRGGQTVAVVRGPARALLTGERVALNFLQRLSGIATLTRRFVDACRGTRARIVDTRKTTPGLRALERYAVRVGGGVNHRFGLADGVLI